MATSPITCPNCGYKNYHPEATACEQCYAPLKPTAGPEDSAGEGAAKPTAKPKDSKPTSRPTPRPAAPLPSSGQGGSAFNALLFALAIPLTFPLAIGASLSGQRQREVVPGNWLLCGAIVLSAWLGIWYSQTGDGSPAWLVWPPVALFVSALFGGMLLVRTNEATPGLVALGVGLTGLAVYGGLQVMEPTPESMTGHSAPINAVAVTPSGDRMLTGSEDGSVRLWNLSTGRSEVLSGHEDGVASVLWSPNAKPISIDYKGKVQVWNLDTSPPSSSETWDAGQGLSCAALAPNGHKVAIGTLTGNVETRNSSDGASSESLLTGGSAISALAYSPDSRIVAVGQLDGTLNLYGALETFIEGGPDSGVRALAFASNEKLVAGYASGEVRVWNAKTGDEVAALAGPEFPVLDLAIRGSTLVALHNNRAVVRWDLGSNKPAGSTELPLGRGGPASQIAILPSGDLLVGNGRAVSRVWVGSLKE